MSMGKIQITIGNISFTGEGDESWVSSQLDKILKAAPELHGRSQHSHSSTAAQTQEQVKADKSTADPVGHGEHGKSSIGPLPNFLKTHNALTNQSRKFLATAQWLYLSSKTVNTREVSKALKESHQSPLTNAAQCLVGNVTKGFCVKDGKGFYITPEGLTHLENKPTEPKN